MFVLQNIDIMATVNFLYRSKKQSAPLTLRLLYRYNEQDRVFGSSTQLEVSKEYWAKQHKQKRPKDIDISNKQIEVNKELNKIENFVLGAFKIADPSTLNKLWLQTHVNNYYNPPKKNQEIPKALVEYIEYYIEYRRHDLKEGVIKKLRVTKHKLERFELYRKKNILINDVNDSFKNEFIDYCKKEGYALNTTERDFGNIKTFCKHARFIGLETSPQLDGLRMEKTKVEIIYLTFNELEKIEKIELNDSLSNARDWLIISCYVGQRVSDFMNFTSQLIRYEKNKHGQLKPLLEFTQKKTNKKMTIPLFPKVIEILDKRNGNFPYSISDQKYNNYIKEVCKKAGVNEKIDGSKITETELESKIYRKEKGNFEKWELITSHIGRRSFASNHYGDYPTSYLIYMTGHSTEKMFLNYIGKSNKDIAMELANYF